LVPIRMGSAVFNHLQYCRAFRGQQDFVKQK
jgi:hypothetical protein